MIDAVGNWNKGHTSWSNRGWPSFTEAGRRSRKKLCYCVQRQNDDLQPVERRKPVSCAFGTRLETSRATLRDFDNGAGLINGTMFEDSQDHLDYKLDTTLGVANGAWTTVETGSGAYDGHAHSDYSGSGSYSNLTTDANGWSITDSWSGDVSDSYHESGTGSGTGSDLDC